MELLLVLGICALSCRARQATGHYSETCTPSDCLVVVCPTMSNIDCEKNELGLLVLKGGRCGCDVCVPFLGENEDCEESHTNLLPRLHDMRAGCKKDLECSRETAKCVKRITLEKGPSVEESCEKAVESMYTSAAHVEQESRATCGPGMAYRGDIDACEVPRAKRDEPYQQIVEPDPQSSHTKSVKVPGHSGRKAVPSRSFLIRWSACGEPNCDRGVCPTKMTRKHFCTGRFFPERHCPCCGECSQAMPGDEDGLTMDEQRMLDRNIGREKDKFSCGNHEADCYQNHKCESGKVHRLKRYSCNGFWESTDPVYCDCCGTCVNYLIEMQACAVIKDGNPEFARPGCTPGLECRKSPIDGKYMCLKPCPLEACASFKCEEGEDRLLDCPSDVGLFKSTKALCACCGECLEYIPLGQACLDGSNPIEPGCAEFLKCIEGKCSREAKVKYIGPGRQKQIEMLLVDSLAWTGFKYPQTDAEGFYYPVQCEAYKCYCVAPDGSELGYVMPRFYAFNMNCDCARQKYYGKNLLKCDHLGNYKELDLAGIPRPPPAVTDSS